MCFKLQLRLLSYTAVVVSQSLYHAEAQTGIHTFLTFFYPSH